MLYLSAPDYTDFQITRKIVSWTELKWNGRTVYRVVVDSPVIGQTYGLGGEDVDTLFLVGRHDDPLDLSSYPFPFYVHVFIPKEKGTNIESITSLKPLQNIAWAAVYGNEEDAINYKIK